jgi:hypothetical protein
MALSGLLIAVDERANTRNQTSEQSAASLTPALLPPDALAGLSPTALCVCVYSPVRLHLLQPLFKGSKHQHQYQESCSKY